MNPTRILAAQQNKPMPQPTADAFNEADYPRDQDKK